MTLRPFVRMAIALASVGLGCQALLDVEPRDPLPVGLGTDATADDASMTDGASIADAALDAAEADSPRDAAIDSATACPAGMILITAIEAGKMYCIDATEVTQAAYRSFLADAGVTPVNARLGAECVGRKLTHDPSAIDAGCATVSYSSPSGLHPMGCVDWCDAYAFCAWAGKRLCKGPAIGSLGLPVDSTGFSEWHRACAGEAPRKFPYGFTRDLQCDGRRDVASAAPCQGSEPGLFDMTGNVAEWDDSCKDDVDQCLVRGGGYGDMSDEELDCPAYGSDGFTNTTRPRLSRWDWGGIRCCKDAQ